ncbi:MAG: Rrf2 family transcriptional regulator [Deltaproteobacteria bacterium]|nr:Rrf2 family transcriptional regulator [Deltaproteobacteria bacterium]
MFRLSKAADYAIRGLVYLSMKSDDGMSGIEEISKARSIPASYLAKLFQTLAKKGFVRSFRGPEGGFALTRPPSDINLLEVIEAVEGPIFLNECLIQRGYCPQDAVCTVHHVWRETQSRFLDCLRSYNFEQLAEEEVAKSKVKQS